MSLQKTIEAAIHKAVRQRVTNKVEQFVKNEVLAELRKKGVTDRRDPRERQNRKIPLATQENLRRTIGTLVMNRVGEKMRFKLEGVKARRPDDEISMAQLEREVKSKINDAVRKGILRRL